MVQIKCANRDKASTIGLKVSPKSQPTQVGKEQIFSVNTETHRTCRKM